VHVCHDSCIALVRQTKTLRMSASESASRQHTATHCNTLYHTADVNTLQHTAAHRRCQQMRAHHVTHAKEPCHTESHVIYTTHIPAEEVDSGVSTPPYDALIILRARPLGAANDRGMSEYQLSKVSCIVMVYRQHTATDCNRLQQTATDCNTLQQTATHCNRLQQTA